MICPNCQNPLGADATSCGNCASDIAELTIAGPAPATAQRRHPSWLVFGGVGAAVLAVGLTAWALVGADAGAGATYVSRIPSEAVFFAEVDVAELTSAETRSVIEAFAPLVEAETGEPFDFDSLVEEAIDSLESEIGDLDLSFRDDIATWATGPVAFAVLPPDEDGAERGVALVGGDDAAALDAFMAKLSHLPDVTNSGTVDIDGVSFHRLDADGSTGLVGRQGTDLILATDEAAAAAVVTPTSGGTLADVAELVTQMDRLPTDAAVVFALSGSSIPDIMGGVDMDLTGSGVGSGWTVGAMSAHPDGFRMDYVAELGDTPAPSFSPELTAAIPGDTVAFFRIGSLIDQIEAVAGSPMLGGMAEELESETGIGTNDVLAIFLVDGGIAVWPSTEPELPVNAAVIGMSDTSQSAFVEDLVGLAAGMGLVPTPVDGGFRFNGLVSLGTRDVLTLLTTEGDLIMSPPSEAFTDGELYGRATELVEGDLVFALDLPSVVDLVDGFVEADDPEMADSLRCLPLGVAAGGVSVSGASIHTSIVIEVLARC